jgi:hypothetical protein
VQPFKARKYLINWVAKKNLASIENVRFGSLFKETERVGKPEAINAIIWVWAIF